jgi:hypothetical protein
MPVAVYVWPYLPILHSLAERIEVLTYTDLRFEQIWCGEVWRSHTFPRCTPIKSIAQQLRCKEPQLRKALIKGKRTYKQWTIQPAA